MVRDPDRYSSKTTLLQVELTNAPSVSGVARLRFRFKEVRTRTKVSCFASSMAAGDRRRERSFSVIRIPKCTA